MIWKRPSGTSLVHHQSWWCASFQYSFNYNHMPTSVDIHISKDDDMKMSCKHIFTPQLVLVNCILLSFIQMQLYAHIDQYPFSKNDDIKMSFRYIFASQSVLVILHHFVIHSNAIVRPYRSICIFLKDDDMKMVFKYIFVCRLLTRVHQVIGCFWTMLPPVDLNMLAGGSCHYQMLIITLVDFADSFFNSFFAPR
jgi:hypothetical protein